jgi:hypothetical protein
MVIVLFERLSPEYLSEGARRLVLHAVGYKLGSLPYASRKKKYDVHRNQIDFKMLHSMISVLISGIQPSLNLLRILQQFADTQS